MSSKDQSNQNIWFGVAMFLIGLIAGVALAFASGSLPMGNRAAAGGTTGTIPSAPQAPTPKIDVMTRMIAYAADIGVNEAEFTACVASNKYNDKINEQMAGGQAAGVNGTPGNIIYDLKSKKGIVVSGAQPIANFQKVIDAMLKDSASALAMPGAVLASDVPAVDFTKDHVRGDTKTARIALIEYSDYECPFCHTVHPTYQKLMDQYDGKVIWIYRHFPLDFHAEAIPLAVGAECVNELAGSDAFWKFSDMVMSK